VQISLKSLCHMPSKWINFYGTRRLRPHSEKSSIRQNIYHEYQWHVFDINTNNVHHAAKNQFSKIAKKHYHNRHLETVVSPDMYPFTWRYHSQTQCSSTILIKWKERRWRFRLVGCIRVNFMLASTQPSRILMQLAKRSNKIYHFYEVTICNCPPSCN
jgi:hypothetical protein